MRKNLQTKLFKRILAANFAVLGICLKPIIAPIANLITDPLRVTGGSTAGGIYMMILVLAGLVIKEKFVCTTVGFIQGCLALVLGITGFQGMLAIVIYTLPGVVADLILGLPIPLENATVLACIGANLSGSILTNFLFFRLPLIPFVLMVMLGIISAWIGGLSAHYLYKRVGRLVILGGNH